MLDFAKNIFPSLEPKLLVMWERISEALQVVCEVLYTMYLGYRVCSTSQFGTRALKHQLVKLYKARKIL
jgi:hypothetical protein